MKKLSIFQIVVTGAFIFFTILGVILFAGIGGGGDTRIGRVVIWGTYDDQIMNGLFNSLSFKDKRFDTVTYVEKDPRFFDEELVEALASSAGPDIFFLAHDTIVRHKDKIFPISYEIMSEREFKDIFIQEGELLLSEEGIIGLPFLVDPMVLYWNRDHYTQVGIARPPKFWDELLPLTLQGKLTILGEDGAVLRSAFSIGEYQNIAHAKELLSMLILQAKGSIVRMEDNDQLSSGLLLRKLGEGQTPVENALRFYTDFANPAKSVYTWNRALPESKQAFVSGILSNYVGFASEFGSIRSQNANLNFDVAPVPQVRSSNNSVTYGNLTSLAIPKTSKNINGALQIVFALSSDAVLEEISKQIGLAPVTRTLLAVRPSDPFEVIFADAALQSAAWLDPRSDVTDQIFQVMIEQVVSGRLQISGAVRTAHQELENLLR